MYADLPCSKIAKVCTSSANGRLFATLLAEVQQWSLDSDPSMPQTNKQTPYELASVSRADGFCACGNGKELSNL